MRSFEVYHSHIAEKLQNLEFSLISSNIWIDFQLFPFFLMTHVKKNLKRAQISWKWCQLLGKHDFLVFCCSRAKIERGGGGHHPLDLAKVQDVALIRVEMCTLTKPWFHRMIRRWGKIFCNNLILSLLQFYKNDRETGQVVLHTIRSFQKMIVRWGKNFFSILIFRSS